MYCYSTSYAVTKIVVLQVAPIPQIAIPSTAVPPLPLVELSALLVIWRCRVKGIRYAKFIGRYLMNEASLLFTVFVLSYYWRPVEAGICCIISFLPK